MNMNQFSGLVTMGFALFALGCDDGGSQGTGGAAGSSAGSSGSGATGGGSGAGGSGTGGSAGTGGGTAAGEELVNETGWVGGDPATPDDDPLGIQGTWYGYGDGTSCADMAGLNPCNATEGCCIDGHTIVDKTYVAWGCGLGLSLNATGGTASVKRAYTGTARNFAVTFTGNTGGSKIHIGFPQASDTTGIVAPYKEVAAITGGAEATVSFADAKYKTVTADPASSYDIQFQVTGGDVDADFDLCIKSLKASP